MRFYSTLVVLVVILACLLLLSGSRVNITGPAALLAAENPHDDPSGKDDHDDHNEHGDQGLRLSVAELEEFGIRLATASPGALEVHVDLPGEVVFNPDRVAHIVPRVAGIARQVRSNVGDLVRQGQVLAVLESRELSEVKSAYLVAKERLSLAQATFGREEKLWKQNISSERVYLEAKQGLSEARIALRVNEQKLHALGFSKQDLIHLSFDKDERFTHYEMVAPFDGSIIKKHVVLGEMLKDDAEAFVVADLGSVWIQLTAYQKDLPFLRVGQRVHIAADQSGKETTATVDYISLTVDETTRAASARIVLPNPDGRWRPGSFVTGRIDVERLEVALLVPRSALQRIENQFVVFIETAEGFEPQPVQIGRTNQTHAEILAGLSPGQRYVAQGAFTLKAQLSKGAFGDGHGH
jgi:cobalt-zinc-cadmium efflux system membrane fusion protein